MRNFTPPDQALWNELKRTLGMVPMSLDSHQQVAHIFGQVERQAIDQQREKAERFKRVLGEGVEPEVSTEA